MAINSSVPTLREKDYKMNELEMIKAFAELEGIEYYSGSFNIYAKKDWGCARPDLRFLGENYILYNPITDLALNCAARDKYETDIEWYYESVSMQSEYTDRPNEFVVRFSGKEELPKAVIECILKSEGLWK